MEVSEPRKLPLTKTKSFLGSYENLAKIGDFVREFAVGVGFTEFAIYSIEMAVDEACSNIIEHAYGGENKGSIDCTCAASDDALTIVLKDQGKAFDPSVVLAPNLSKDLNKRKAHGLGLYFIRQWMDDVRFSSDGVENVLTMVKRKPPAE